MHDCILRCTLTTLLHYCIIININFMMQQVVWLYKPVMYINHQRCIHLSTQSHASHHLIRNNSISVVYTPSSEPLAVLCLEVNDVYASLLGRVLLYILAWPSTYTCVCLWYHMVSVVESVFNWPVLSTSAKLFNRTTISGKNYLFISQEVDHTILDKYSCVTVSMILYNKPLTSDHHQ